MSAILRFANAFEGLGVRSGMLIGLGSSQFDRALDLIVTLALQSLGAVRTLEWDDQRLISACDLMVVFSPPETRQSNAKTITLPMEWLSTTIRTSPSTGDGQRLLAQAFLSERPLLFGNTSGTTGEKKFFFEKGSAVGAQIDLIASEYFQGSTTNFISLYGVNVSAAYVAACAAFKKGGTVIFSSLEGLIPMARRYPNSHTLMILREASYFAKSIPTELDEVDRLYSVRVLGAHLPQQVRHYLSTHVARRVCNSFSSNEAGQIAEIGLSGEGKLYSGVQVKIVDDDGNDVAPGLMGRIATKSPQQISGYLWSDALNAMHFKEGWFISQDIGYIPKPGYLVYVDRADHMINLGGIKTAPKPIEDQIKLLPQVNDCVLLSENAFFAIETLLIGIEAAGDSDQAHLNTQIAALLQGTFAAYRIFYMEQFPRTETGKIKRFELHTLFLKACIK